jgi:MoxR-like ATPase
MEIKQRVSEILKGLGEGIYEKEEVIGLGLLASVAGESLFLLGPPGVAKSLIARRLKYAFKDGKSFEYLMSKFSTPDEIFGPVSIKKLKDEDKYERLTERYMPGANVVFLDEIWKAGPSIQNALLTIINEKIFRNGEKDEEVDIKLIVSASNELPSRGEGLEALWDRFLLRFELTEIKEKGNFLNMITNTEDIYKDSVSETAKFSNAELEEWNKKIQQIVLPKEVVNTIQVIKHRLDEYDATSDTPFSVYDRRWKKLVNLLRTSAFLNDRKEVDLMDCFLSVHSLWSSPLHIDALREIIAETIRKHGYSVALNLVNLKLETNQFEQEVREETEIPNTITIEEPYLIDKKFYEVLLISNVMDGKYIKASEFERLQMDEESTIGLYDDNFKLTYKMRAEKHKEENMLQITHSSQAMTFKLKTEKVEKIEYLTKKPHPIVMKYWKEQFDYLYKYVKNLQTQLNEDKPQQLEHLKTNLFVPAHLSKIVEANMIDSINDLNTLQLRLEKIEHFYKRFED